MHMPVLGWFLWLFLAPAARPAEPPAPEVAVSPTLAYRLGPGDIVDILVFEVEELSKPAVLAPDGTVMLPLAGAVELAGLTVREAAERLRVCYAGSLIRNPQISVAVREYHSRPVAVLGAVNKPGVYTLQEPRRLSDLIALAAGLAPDAGSEISIARPLAAGGERTLTTATRDLLEAAAGHTANPWIEAHDTVRVAKAGMICVVGEVGRAGGFPLPHQGPITVLRALSLAEGLRRTSAPQRARILRAAPACRQEIPARLADILAGKAPDLPLEPNDILFVPDSRAKGAFARSTEAAIQMATGVVIWRR